MCRYCNRKPSVRGCAAGRWPAEYENCSRRRKAQEKRSRRDGCRRDSRFSHLLLTAKRDWDRHRLWLVEANAAMDLVDSQGRAFFDQEFKTHRMSEVFETPNCRPCGPTLIPPRLIAASLDPHEDLGSRPRYSLSAGPAKNGHGKKSIGFSREQWERQTGNILALRWRRILEVGRQIQGLAGEARRGSNEGPAAGQCSNARLDCTARRLAGTSSCRSAYAGN